LFAENSIKIHTKVCKVS